MNSFRILSICFSLFAFLFSAFAGSDRLIAFELEDQFETMHSNDELLGHVVVLVGSDRDGSAFNSIWTSAIQSNLGDQYPLEGVRFVGLADLRGVPFFLMSFVRGKFPQDPESWTLLDWKGEFAKTYQFVSGMSNLLLFDQKGELVYQAADTELDEGELILLLDSLKSVL